MDGERQALLRRLPKIDQVLAREDISGLPAPRWAVVEAVRGEVEALRRAIVEGRGALVEVEAGAVKRRAEGLVQPSLRRVINATGVVLHTNLGRAPLGAEVLARVTALGASYSNLEYDVENGQRGSRHGHVARLVRDVTGAEDAVAVNNNAGAVMLALAAMAAGRAVIVSRGELIEIGGSFRIPDVMRMSGATLVEVGTTNKTHARDYEDAISADTALLLKVHRSNFDVVGFTAEVDTAELVELGRARGVPTMMDLGSGVLLEPAELAALGLPPEPSARAVVASGADLVTFSGDKLLGGPQAGIIAGRSAAVARVRSHPMMRALRPDKLTIAALEATLAIYRDGRARQAIPAVAMLAAPLEVLRARAETLRAKVGGAPDWLALDLVPCESAVGGGAMPTTALPSWAVALRGGDRLGPDAIDAALRAGDPPIIGRITDDMFLLDVRTLADAELDEVARGIGALAIS
ncbi:MAG TPA: L-seryl-tRNA(Sec) selenium transferase [Kofleriaceae bacterium]|nr:L-seryl-tRNA(Sec) selenium transferase [Kofleriaceae bacterium]